MQLLNILTVRSQKRNKIFKNKYLFLLNTCHRYSREHYNKVYIIHVWQYIIMCNVQKSTFIFSVLIFLYTVGK